MKILIIVPYYKPAYIYGGPIESVSKLCEGLVAENHLVDVYTTTANGKDELDVVVGYPVEVDNVKVTYFRRLTKGQSFISLSLIYRLYKNIKSYDIVHIQTWWNPLVLISALICIQRGVKFVVSPRGMLSEYIINSGHYIVKRFLHLLVGKFGLSRSYLHATTRAEFEECRQIIPEWKGFILPNILSLPDIPVDKHINSRFTILFLSRIHPKKGLELLFKAIRLLKTDIVLRIAGSGEENYVESLKSLVARLGISNKIEWVGWLDRDRKFSALQEADLLVLPSFNENFANVVIESLHMGTAVMISKEVALSDFVEKNDLGWIVERNERDIANTLCNIIENRPKLENILRIGRFKVEESFDSKKLILEYIKAYKKIL